MGLKTKLWLAANYKGYWYSFAVCFVFIAIGHPVITAVLAPLLLVLIMTGYRAEKSLLLNKTWTMTGTGIEANVVSIKGNKVTVLWYYNKSVNVIDKHVLFTKFTPIVRPR